jgi:hypothetical protein
MCGANSRPAGAWSGACKRTEMNATIAAHTQLLTEIKEVHLLVVYGFFDVQAYPALQAAK